MARRLDYPPAGQPVPDEERRERERVATGFAGLRARLEQRLAGADALADDIDFMERALDLIARSNALEQALRGGDPYDVQAARELKTALEREAGTAAPRAAEPVAVVEPPPVAAEPAAAVPPPGEPQPAAGEPAVVPDAAPDAAVEAQRETEMQQEAERLNKRWRRDRTQWTVKADAAEGAWADVQSVRFVEAHITDLDVPERGVYVHVRVRRDGQEPQDVRVLPETISDKLEASGGEILVRSDAMRGELDTLDRDSDDVFPEGTPAAQAFAATIERARQAIMQYEDAPNAAERTAQQQQAEAAIQELRDTLDFARKDLQKMFNDMHAAYQALDIVGQRSFTRRHSVDIDRLKEISNKRRRGEPITADDLATFARIQQIAADVPAAANAAKREILRAGEEQAMRAAYPADSVLRNSSGRDIVATDGTHVAQEGRLKIVGVERDAAGVPVVKAKLLSPDGTEGAEKMFTDAALESSIAIIQAQDLAEERASLDAITEIQNKGRALIALFDRAGARPEVIRALATIRADAEIHMRALQQAYDDLYNDPAHWKIPDDQLEQRRDEMRALATALLDRLEKNEFASSATPLNFPEIRDAIHELAEGREGGVAPAALKDGADNDVNIVAGENPGFPSGVMVHPKIGAKLPDEAVGVEEFVVRGMAQAQQGRRLVLQDPETRVCVLVKIEDMRAFEKGAFDRTAEAALASSIDDLVRDAAAVFVANSTESRDFAASVQAARALVDAFGRARTDPKQRNEAERAAQKAVDELRASLADARAKAGEQVELGKEETALRDQITRAETDAAAALAAGEEPARKIAAAVQAARDKVDALQRARADAAARKTAKGDAEKAVRELKLQLVREVSAKHEAERRKIADAVRKAGDRVSNIEVTNPETSETRDVPVMVFPSGKVVIENAEGDGKAQQLPNLDALADLIATSRLSSGKFTPTNATIGPEVHVPNVKDDARPFRITEKRFGRGQDIPRFLKTIDTVLGGEIKPGHWDTAIKAIIDSLNENLREDKKARAALSKVEGAYGAGTDLTVSVENFLLVLIDASQKLPQGAATTAWRVAEAHAWLRKYGLEAAPPAPNTGGAAKPKAGH